MGNRKIDVQTLFAVGIHKYIRRPRAICGVHVIVPQIDWLKNVPIRVDDLVIAPLVPPPHRQKRPFAVETPGAIWSLYDQDTRACSSLAWKISRLLLHGVPASTMLLSR